MSADDTTTVLRDVIGLLGEALSATERIRKALEGGFRLGYGETDVRVPDPGKTLSELLDAIVGDELAITLCDAVEALYALLGDAEKAEREHLLAIVRASVAAAREARP